MQLRKAGVIACCASLMIAVWWGTSRGVIPAAPFSAHGRAQSLDPPGAATAAHGGARRALAGDGDSDPAERDVAVVRGFDAVLGEERLDAEWSAAMSDRVKAYLGADPSMDASFKSIECKTTLCRVRIGHKTDEARRSFTPLVGAMIPPRSQAFIYAGEGGDSTIYFAREGHTLPLK